MNIRTRLLEAYEDGLINRPCVEALDWLGRRRSLQRAWTDCPDGSWLLWLMEEVGVDISTAWMVREIVAPALLRAAGTLDDAGIEHNLWEHAKACATAQGEEEAEAAARAAWAAAEAAAAASWAAAGAASWAAAGAAAWAATDAAAAWAAAAAAAAWATDATWAAAARFAEAAAAELLRIANAVRARWPAPPPEVLALLEAT